MKIRYKVVYEEGQDYLKLFDPNERLLHKYKVRSRSDIDAILHHYRVLYEKPKLTLVTNETTDKI